MAQKDNGESTQPTNIPHFRQVLDQAGVTLEVQKWDWEGSGTEEDPYVVTWIDNDPRNPMMYSTLKKWGLTMMVAFATLAVAFVSSAYSGGSIVRHTRYLRRGSPFVRDRLILIHDTTANYKGVQMHG